MLMADGYHNADVLDHMVNHLRSRPHTPAPDYMDVEIQAKLQLVREEAAKAERERVLDEARFLIVNKTLPKEPEAVKLKQTILGLLKSLRQQEGQR
jgi:hypothetical protein